MNWNPLPEGNQGGILKLGLIVALLAGILVTCCIELTLPLGTIDPEYLEAAQPTPRAASGQFQVPLERAGALLPAHQRSFRGTNDLLDNGPGDGLWEEEYEPAELAGSSVPPPDIIAVLNSLSNREDELANDLQRVLVRRWAEYDPRAAAEWVSVLPVQTSREQCVLQVATAWGAIDFRAAAEWARTLQPSEASVALASIAYEAARTAPVEALRIATALPSASGRDELLSFAVSEWASSDPKTATAWARKLQEPRLREQLLAAIAVSWAEWDPAGAATLAATQCSGEEQNRAAVAILQRWTQSAPYQAASWVQDFPESPLREQATDLLVQLWAAQDSETLAHWLQSLPDGSFRASAIASYSLGLR